MATKKVIKPHDVIMQIQKAFESAERHNFESVWDVISEFMMPNQSGLFLNGGSASQTDLQSAGSSGTNRGGKKTRRLFDSTAIQANQDLSSAIFSALFGGNSKFIKLRYKNELLNGNQEAIEWLEDSINRMHQMIQESNLTTELAKALRFYPSLGSMALMHETKESPEDGTVTGFKFKSYHLAEVAWLENHDSLVDVVYRKFSLTAKQAVERFEMDRLPDAVGKAIEFMNFEKEFEFIHCLMPRDPDMVEEGLTTPDKRPIASYYVSVNNPRVFLEEGGFYEFPVYVVRWDTVPGEIYGRGPGHIALPDVRTLNRAKELGLDAIARAINPPMLANQRDVIGQLDLRPKSISMVRDINGIRELVPQTRFDVSQFSVNELQESIKKVFFLDKLLLPPRTDTGEMTAFEVSQRVEQIQKVLGSTFGRLNKELLEPMVIRSFKIMLRSGLFLEMPPVIDQIGLDLDIVFVNQLARSQKMEDVNAIQTWLNNVAQIAQFKPEALDLIDVDRVVKHMAREQGVPELAVTDDEDLEAIRQQRAELAQQQLQQEQLTAGADILSKVQGTTNPSGGN